MFVRLWLKHCPGPAKTRPERQLEPTKWLQPGPRKKKLIYIFKSNFVKKNFVKKNFVKKNFVKKNFVIYLKRLKIGRIISGKEDSRKNR